MAKQRYVGNPTQFLESWLPRPTRWCATTEPLERASVNALMDAAIRQRWRPTSHTQSWEAVNGRTWHATYLAQ